MAQALVSVIGSQFMVPYESNIICDINSSGYLVITDSNHRLLLKVKGCNSNFHRQRVLLDVDDNPIVTIREKKITGHDRWNVFRGYSEDESDIIFTTKKTHMLQFKTNVDVFLAYKDVSDFKIKGGWTEKNFTIYMGKTTIAQMYKMDSFISDKFMVTIHPDVDYAFVVALIAIVEAMKSSDKNDICAGAAFVSGVVSICTL